jgi:hypothetical protein
MRVCIIGNSHAAALKSALGSGSTIGSCDFDFYLIAGGYEPQLTWTGGRLRPLAAERVPQTTVARAAEEGLDLAPFDAVVVSACGLFAARNQNVVFDPACHPLSSVCVAGWLGDEAHAWPTGTQFVSAAVFDEIVASCLEQHASIRLARLLAQVFPGRVILQPWPAPNRTLRDNSSWFLNVGYGLTGGRVWCDFMSAQYRALTAVAAELGSSCTLLPYPLAESLRDGFIDGELCSPDPWHGNEKYGALVLDQICEALATANCAHPIRSTRTRNTARWGWIKFAKRWREIEGGRAERRK